MIGLTTTYWKIREMKAPIKLVQGGQGAGKNYAMAIHLLERQDARIITVLADTYDNLKDGILTDYENIFQWSDLNLYDFYNKQEKVLTWGKTKIQFRYIADHKPHAGKSKRREILYINEGNKIGWAAAEPYISRSKEVFIDFNPDFEFWAHTELEPRDDCEKIVVTYMDNEMCPENEVRYIESRKDNEQWYRVYGLGLTGTYSDRRIYSFEMVDEVPETAKRIPSGMDFGQSPDPSVLIDCYIEGTNLYLDLIFRENNLMPEKIAGAERMSIVDKLEEVGFPKDWQIIGDSSGKIELLDMKKHGYNARGVKKGPGSVKDGIKKMRSYNLKVTKRSPTVKTALESWFWKTDHNGKIVPEPDGHEPDELAATRYVCLAKALW